MTELNLKQGCKVVYQGKSYRMGLPISLEQTFIQDLETGEKLPAKITDLTPLLEDKKLNARDNTTDLILISNVDWQEAKRRQAVLDPLMEQTKCSLEQARQAAEQLNLSWRQIYTLLKRYRDYDKQLLALLPQQPTGGKGRMRLPFTTEQIIEYAIENRYLTRQQTKISLIVEEIMVLSKLSTQYTKNQFFIFNLYHGC